MKPVLCMFGTHKWEGEYVNEASCELERHCVRCHVQDHQIVHDWTAWRYVAEESCEQERQCRRPDGIREIRIHHIWDERRKNDMALSL